MIAEIGLFALILALFVAAVQAVVPLLGAARGETSWMNLARPASAAQFALVSLAFAALIWLHVTSDLSVLNVALNSHTDKPLLYKITGVWGNHEGSMLLWVFILALYGLMAALFGKTLPPALRARALSVQGMIAFGFLLFILMTSNPSRGSTPRRSTATASTRCSKTPASPSTRPSSISAMSASRWRSPSPSPH